MCEAIKIARELAKKFEGLKLEPYLCPANVPTIGYGTTRYPDGVRVTLADGPISEDRALFFLEQELEQSLIEAIELCPNLKDHSAERQGAITDFIYNLGARNFSESTLRKRILAEQWEDVPAQLLRWVKGGGEVLPGLVKRREAEAALI